MTTIGTLNVSDTGTATDGPHKGKRFIVRVKGTEFVGVTFSTEDAWWNGGGGLLDARTPVEVPDTAWPVEVPPEFAVGVTVRATETYLQGSEFDGPCTIAKVMPKHPHSCPVYVETASGRVGAFHPRNLEILP